MAFRDFALTTVALASAPAFAESTTTTSVTGGSLGIGPEIAWRGDRIGIRGNATFLSFGHSLKSTGVRYDGTIKLGSAGAMLDLYPFGGGFRVSGGARYNANKARAVATPMQNASIGGQVFTPAQIGTLHGRAEVTDLAPALTLGYGSGPGRGFAWGVEGGALFQGRVRISTLTSSTGLIPQARLDAERDDLQHDVGKYKVYPIAQLSVGYRF
jgi:hypothetical protein